MGNYLLAVLVGPDATIDSVDAQLAAPMRHLLRSERVDSYRLGGAVTGAWDPSYTPESDPRNWRTCSYCNGTSCATGTPCPLCGHAADEGREPGTVVAFPSDWARHPGDIVPLAELLAPQWRFPPGRTPDAWVDRAGVVWLGTETAVAMGTDTGQVPTRLRQVFDDLVTGRRNPEPQVRKDERRFDAATARVAVVQAHH